MSVESARAALINLASSWRAQGAIAAQVGHTRHAAVYAACAARLDEAIVTHLRAVDDLCANCSHSVDVHDQSSPGDACGICEGCSAFAPNMEDS